MRYGSLCSGIGGLDLAVETVFDATPAWFCEYDKHAASVLDRHWPGVPIYPDVKTTDWYMVEPVELLCAGYPCQPFSHAGKRGGEDDPRHLWPFVLNAVRVLRPRLVVLENVAGHLSLGFDTVLGDLAEAGFDAEWTVVRASDIGACHQRARLFVVATDNQVQQQREPFVGVGERSEPRGSGQGVASDASHLGCERGEPARQRGTGPTNVAWGDYEPAIARHEHTLGRPAPAPTDQRGRLAVPFVEWMQMLPEGWVDGLSRTQALKALGNCVVPAQVIAALKALA